MPTLPPIVRAGEFLAEPIPEPKRLIHGIADYGDKFIIVGSAKSYKSWGLLQLCVQMSRRDRHGDWLGFKVEHVPTLYLNFELSKYYFQRRLEAFSKTLEVVGELDINIWNLKGYEMLTRYDIFLPALATACKRQPGMCVFLDPFYKIYKPDMKENDNGEISSMMSALSNLIRDADCSLIFAHHMPKGDMTTRDPIDRAAGAGSIIRDVDGMLFITKTPKKPKHFSTHWEFRNHPCVEPFPITWSYPAYHRDDAPEGIVEQSSTELTPTQVAILNLLRPAPLKYADWKALAIEHGHSTNTFPRIVGALERAGLTSMENSLWKVVDTKID